MEKQRIEIEEKILEIANKKLKKWNEKFQKTHIYVEPLQVIRNNNDSDYFSEIEFNIWKNNSLETFFSLIIFMNSKLMIEINEVDEYLNKEIEVSYNEFL